MGFYGQQWERAIFLEITTAFSKNSQKKKGGPDKRGRLCKRNIRRSVSRVLSTSKRLDDHSSGPAIANRL